MRYNDKLNLGDKEIKIRSYKENDKENVRFVCLNSEGPCRHTQRGINFALAVFCDYYIENEPENCFVVADDNDKAVGYIISAESFDAFKERFISSYYTKIKKWEYLRRKSALKSIEAHENIKMNILPIFISTFCPSSREWVTVKSFLMLCVIISERRMSEV